MYGLKVEVRFRAGHRLIFPYKGKCNNLHGEAYTAIIEFEDSNLDENGMIMDFGEVKKKIKLWIDENWDHAYIHHTHDIWGASLFEAGLRTFDLGDMNPTAENMARVLYHIIKVVLLLNNIKKVSIVESFEDSIASYEETK